MTAPPAVRVVIARCDGRDPHRAGDAQLRRLLAAVLRCPPTAVPLVTSPSGRPEVAGGAGPWGSISHTADLVVAAVSTVGPIGVDAERLDRVPLPPARLWLAPAERRTGREDHGALVRRWTAKEAVAKALGRGLAAPLSAIVVTDDTTAVAPNGTRWTLRARTVDDRVAVTLAIPAGAPPTRWTPGSAAVTIVDTGEGGSG